METPLNYSKVYPYFIKTLAIIDKNALESDSVDSIYYGMKNYISNAFEKCSYNSSYCDGWLIWFMGKKSTLHLRSLMNEVHCDYWAGLFESNLIDRLDSYQKQIIFEI